MKKVSILLIGVFALLCTGCGDKKAAGSKNTLECTTNIQGLKSVMIYEVVDNKVANVKMESYIDLSQYTEEQIDTVRNEDFCPQLDSSKYENCKSSVSGKQYILKADYKLSEEEKIENVTINELKEKIESDESFTCVIK